MNDESRVIDMNVPVTAVDVTGDKTRRRLPRGYLAFKRIFDIALALGAMPILILISIVLIFANPLWNRGPLFYSQLRMGRRCKPFMAYKFRTMTSAPDVARGPNDPLETDRITRLGYLLRRLRLDEMPQFVNVLLGEMSVIGPRPDYWDHAVHYSETVPGYRQRHAMRPGITGLAQVDNGYAEGTDATFVKTRHDMRYINSASLATDWYILRKTIVVIFTGFGAR
jgi:lipopolysaccharide/colanic/teichoic acid biosynthesis glycosyltransferase